MITVRFATGFSIQYNDANFIDRGTNYCRLLDKQDGRLIAQVPIDGCVIEFQRPCETYSALSNASSALDQVISAARSRRYGYPDRRRLAELRRLLQRFSVRSGTWKES